VEPSPLGRGQGEGYSADRNMQTPAVILSATDPANPYGAALPWPNDPATRLARAAGAYVAIVDGALAAYVGRGEREVSTFLPNEEPAHWSAARALADAIARWAEATGRVNLGWSTVDGFPVARGPLTPFLFEAGFSPFGSTMRLAGRGAGPSAIVRTNGR
jgi:ATP-dependent Lhr-like helicase